MSAPIIVIMGVAGAGKTTVGQLLAGELGWSFVDADPLHPAANIDKMSRGLPLNDADRAPWLIAVRDRMITALARQENLVVACSALKQRYRDTLSAGVAIAWVYLQGSREQIRGRLERRSNHFFPAEMLDSQFADLEEPVDAIVVAAQLAPRVAVQQVMNALAIGGKIGRGERI